MGGNVYYTIRKQRGRHGAVVGNVEPFGAFLRKRYKSLLLLKAEK